MRSRWDGRSMTREFLAAVAASLAIAPELSANEASGTESASLIALASKARATGAAHQRQRDEFRRGSGKAGILHGMRLHTSPHS